MNQIYLGQRAYGFASAARVYFGKSIKDVTPAEGRRRWPACPKAPSRLQPGGEPAPRQGAPGVASSGACATWGYLTPEQYDQAVREGAARCSEGSTSSRTHAEYVAEIVRQLMYAQYREETYTRGLNVYTTLNQADQDAAYDAVRGSIMTYERKPRLSRPGGVYRAAVRSGRARAGHRRRPGGAPGQRRPALGRGHQRDAQAGTAPRCSSGEVATIEGQALRFIAPSLVSNAQPKVSASGLARSSASRRTAKDNTWSVTPAASRWRPPSSR